MSWEVVTFETKRGERPVAEFIKSLSKNTISKVAHELDLLEKYGNLLRMPYSKQVFKDVYELRIRGREEARILYAFRGKKIYLLHGFKKKTQKTPAKEVKVAVDRLDSV